MRLTLQPALLAGLGAAVLGAWLLVPESRLQLADDRGTRLLETDGPLTVRYRHSVALSAVEEDFVPTTSGAVRVTETRFSGSGAGLPSQPEWSGTFSANPGEPFRVANMRDEFPSVFFRVGYVSDQTVLANGTAVRLDTLAPPGSRITLRGVSRARIAWWLREAP